MAKRHDLMREFKAKARDCDRRGDTIMRTLAANDWRELATTIEASRAAKYLTWTGRKAIAKAGG